MNTNRTNHRLIELDLPAKNCRCLAVLPGATSGDLYDMITARLEQLRAQLLLTYGEQGESFRRMAGEIQDCYLWGCEEKVSEVLELVVAMHEIANGRVQ